MKMVSLEALVSQKHQYSKFKKLFNFKAIESELKSVKSGVTITLMVVVRLFKCLLRQFMEDLRVLSHLVDAYLSKS
ncbi:MAG: hypothetical protein AB8B66_03440 [Rickettsiaceae bacterium]